VPRAPRISRFLEDRSQALRASAQALLGCTCEAALIAAAHHDKKGRHVMLYWSLMFLVIALIAGVLGFFGIAGTAAGIAKILFFAFLVIAVVSLLMGRRNTSAV
jgi:uncharacterized membrane protein YtjA (UPF0391 family)